MSLVGCSQPLTLRQRICFLHIIRATVRFTPEGDARDAIRDVRFGSLADGSENAMSALPPIADMVDRIGDIRFVPIGDMAAGCNFMRRVHS
jgi:hypothetical protein